MILPFLLAQVTPVQPLPKGTGLPPPVSEESAVMVPIDRLLGAVSTGDGAAVIAATRPDGGATVALERPDGTRAVRHLSWQQFAAALKPGPDRLAERITDPAVEIDGDIAMVWAPYTFTKNGAVEHCGYDHFDLVREGGSWRILNVTWSQRTTGCVAR